MFTSLFYESLSDGLQKEAINFGEIGSMVRDAFKATSNAATKSGSKLWSNIGEIHPTSGYSNFSRMVRSGWDKGGSEYIKARGGEMNFGDSLTKGFKEGSNQFHEMYKSLDPEMQKKVLSTAKTIGTGVVGGGAVITGGLVL